MFVSKFCGITFRVKQFAPQFYRCYATTIEKELEVPMFCDLHVQIPYSLNVKPLNVHKYHNCDKLILKFDKQIENTLKYDVNGNQITVIDEKQGYDGHEKIELSIKAPVKANLYINCKNDIKVGYFHGDKLYLESQNGDINIDKFQGAVVRLITHNGDINIKEFIQASDVDAAIMNTGNIFAGRLQCMNVKMFTHQGNILVNSSYSHESHFRTTQGNIDLHNAHKSCKIFVEDGNINLTGFDGKIKTVIDKGSANIQISRITDNSELNILNGSLILKLAEACQEYTEFRIKTLDWEIPDNFKMTVRNCDGVVHLIPDLHDDNIVKVNCMNGSVDVESASWQDMIKMKLKNKNSH